MHTCRLRLIDCLNLSEIEQIPENKEEVNSYDSKEMRVSGNNEQYVRVAMLSLISPVCRKLKIGWYLLEKVETNRNVEQFILELVNRRRNINIGST